MIPVITAMLSFPQASILPLMKSSGIRPNTRTVNFRESYLFLAIFLITNIMIRRGNRTISMIRFLPWWIKTCSQHHVEDLIKNDADLSEALKLQDQDIDRNILISFILKYNLRNPYTIPKGR